MSADLYGYGSVRGHEPLRISVRDYLARSRMLLCSLDQIVITTGTQEALDLIARLFVDPWDRVIIEEPSYPTARKSFLSAGAEITPVPVDVDGLDVDHLAREVDGGKLIYVTPSHQFPTGGLLPLARRRALLDWARRTGTLIVEDDYDSEFRYGQRPIEALAALESASAGPRSVIYVGTFSKVLFPSLRLGYIVLPRDLVDRVLAAKQIADRHPPTLLQATVAEFINGGHFERHLAQMRRLYAGRSRTLLGALERHFGARATPHPASTTAGLHLLVAFELGYNEQEMVNRAAAAGILIEGASACYLTPPEEPSALLGYGVMDERDLEAGLAALARALLR
jgi:GntR family transcriptional regulator/MocR family aminotransferase